MFRKARLYYHTLKYLKWEQIFFRLLYRIKRARVKPLSEYQVIQAKNWHWDGPECIEQSMIDEKTFRFLNETHAINSKDYWNSKKIEKLWLYNLHYFDDLNAINSSDRSNLHKQLIDRWIKENRPVSGNAWEPYPLSLRIVNLVKWLSRQKHKNSLWHASLMQQIHALSQQLEYHILGNHLFANAKALVFAGTYLKTPDAEELKTRGLKILDQQINEQFLSDGGHFERSPMYHCILLNDLLELVHLTSISKDPHLKAHFNDWLQISSRALRFLEGMTHPDGGISFFNDASFGIAPPVNHIFEFARQLGISHRPIEPGITTFKESGYSRLARNKHTVFFDHGDIGPDYLPGHAHADTLSFEYSYDSSRIIVNSGTSLYGTSPERHRQRSTAAHSTVEVNNRNSSEVWGGFRVAQRAYAKLLTKIDSDVTLQITAEHDGYSRQKSGPLHKRTITVNDNATIIIDNFSSRPDIAKAYFHLHPKVDVEQLNSTKVKLTHSELKNKTFLFTSSSSIEAAPGTWHPYFGDSVKNHHLVIETNESEVKTTITVIEE